MKQSFCVALANFLIIMTNQSSPIAIAEASCRSQIRTAQAVATELGPNRAKSSGVEAWAKVPMNASERGVQKVVKEQKTKLDVTVEDINSAGQDMSWISPRAWLQFLLSMGLWHRLAGLEFERRNEAGDVWQQFWDTYEILHPSFEVFGAPFDQKRTAAIYIHGDEGRTLKKGGLMVTSIQSCLGFGFDQKRLKRRIDGSYKHLVNYVGHTFATRFVCFVLPKTAYEKKPQVLHEMMNHLGESLGSLLAHGIQGPDGHTYRLCVIATKGDWPYLVKVGGLQRHFFNYSQKRQPKETPEGGVPLVLGRHKPASLWRDWGVESVLGGNNRSSGTLASDTVIPETLTCWFITSSIPLSRGSLAHGTPWYRKRLYCFNDLHGIAAGSLQAGRRKMELANRALPSFLQEKQLATPHHQDYTTIYGILRCWRAQWHVAQRRTHHYSFEMAWEAATRFESTKGNSAGESLWRNSSPEQSVFLSVQLQFFLDRDESLYCSHLGWSWLVIYRELAELTFAQGWAMYPLLLKAHAFEHMVLRMRRDAMLYGISLNPLVVGCQADEDLVGRISRLSRRVSIRVVIQRTLQRYLIQAYSTWTAAGIIKDGWAKEEKGWDAWRLAGARKDRSKCCCFCGLCFLLVQYVITLGNFQHWIVYSKSSWGCCYL